jgi:hypothetical protein
MAVCPPGENYTIPDLARKAAAAILRARANAVFAAEDGDGTACALPSCAPVCSTAITTHNNCTHSDNSGGRRAGTDDENAAADGDGSTRALPRMRSCLSHRHYYARQK